MRFRQETITAIDPSARRVTTDGGTYETGFGTERRARWFGLAAGRGAGQRLAQ